MEEEKESKEARTREKITTDTVIPPLPPKTERLAVPDEDRFQHELKSIDGRIAKLRDKKKAIHDQIKIIKEGRKMESQQVSVKSFVNAKVLTNKEFLKKRSKLREELNALKQDFFAMIDEQKRIRPKIKVFDREEAEKQIESLQTKIETTSLTLQEEKKCIAELSILQQSLPLITQHNTRSKKIDQNKERQDHIRAEIASITQEIGSTNSLIETTVTRSNSNKEQDSTEIPLLYQETKHIHDEIEKIDEERKILIDEHRDKKSAYQRQQNYIKHIEFISKIKEKLIKQEETKKAEEAYKKMQELNKPHPYAKEISSCATFISYLNQFIPKENIDSHKQTQERPETDLHYLQAKAALNVKESEEWFGTGQKKTKKKRNKKLKQLQELLSSLPIDLLNFFSYCDIKVPTNIEEVKIAIEELETKKKAWAVLHTREDEKKKNQIRKEGNKSVDLSLNPVNFPAPVDSNTLEIYEIFKDEGPVLQVKEELFKEKREIRKKSK